MLLGRVDNRAASTRSKRGNGDQDSPAHSNHYVQLSRGRVLPQDTALKGAAAEERSAPETLTTACHAASWLARSWRCGCRIASIGPVNFRCGEAKNCPETSVPNSDAWRYR